MKLRYTFILLLGFFFSTSVIAKADANSNIDTSETDRVIVETTSSNGKEKVESVTWDKLDHLSNADVIQPDYIRSVSLETVNEGVSSWGTQRVNIEKMKQQFAYNTGNVVVAVIDTGVDYTHPFLKNRIIEGYDFVDNDTDPMDMHYHGTHIAGIITETTTKNVKIMPIRALDENGNGYDSSIAKGIRYAVEHGADIINMSFEGKEYSKYLAGALNYAISKDVLVIAAAGNKGADTAGYYPSSEEKVVVVSATDESDHVATFSNTGNSIDISAPGVGIISSVPGGKYNRLSGTSMAAPFISGVAAMLKLDKPNRTMSEIESLLKSYVDDRGLNGWDSSFGEGIVNVAAFKKYALTSEQLKSPDTIVLPEQNDVALDKKWTIQFNNVLKTDSIVSVKVYNDSEAFPITYTFNKYEKSVVVSALQNYTSNTTYTMEIVLKNGKHYIKKFTTE